MKSSVLYEWIGSKVKYGHVTSPIWGSLSHITDQLYEKNTERQPTKIETLDLPELHEQVNRGRLFIEALHECPD